MTFYFILISYVSGDPQIKEHFFFCKQRSVLLLSLAIYFQSMKICFHVTFPFILLEICFHVTFTKIIFSKNVIKCETTNHTDYLYN